MGAGNVTIVTVGATQEEQYDLLRNAGKGNWVPPKKSVEEITAAPVTAGSEKNLYEVSNEK